MKTTVAGIITIIAAILSVVATLLIGGPVDWGTVGGQIVAAVGLIAGGVGLLKASDDPAQK